MLPKSVPAGILAQLKADAWHPPGINILGKSCAKDEGRIQIVKKNKLKRLFGVFLMHHFLRQNFWRQDHHKGPKPKPVKEGSQAARNLECWLWLHFYVDDNILVEIFGWITLKLTPELLGGQQPLPRTGRFTLAMEPAHWGRGQERLHVSTVLRFSLTGNLPPVILNSLSTLHSINCFRNYSLECKPRPGWLHALAAPPGLSAKGYLVSVEGQKHRKANTWLQQPSTLLTSTVCFVPQERGE